MKKTASSFFFDLHRILANRDNLKDWDAVRRIRSEDHYLLVLVDSARPGKNYSLNDYRLKAGRLDCD